MKYKVLKQQDTYDLCFVCGRKNDAGLHSSFYECINKDKETVILTVVTPKPHHQSYPDRMHGGVVTALLDESIGRTVQIGNPDIFAVTIDLSVKFRKATPIDQTIYLESKLTSHIGRAFQGEGKLFTPDGTICATATGKFIIVPIKKLLGDKAEADSWLRTHKKFPKFITAGK